MRHSNPAASKIASSPSASAARLTAIDPGTTSALRMLGAMVRPFRIAAARRRSPIRLLVQLPLTAAWLRLPARAVPGGNPMYSCAREGPVGMRSVTATVCSGLVPQLTIGAMLAASIVISRSNCASGSEWSVCQYGSSNPAGA